MSLPLIACTCLGGSSLGSTSCLGKFLKGTLPQSSTSKTSDRCPCDLCRFRVLQDPLLFVLWYVVDCLSVVLYCHSSSFHRTSIPAASLFVDSPVYMSVPAVGLRVGDAVVTSPTRATCHHKHFFSRGVLPGWMLFYCFEGLALAKRGLFNCMFSKYHLHKP